MVPNFQAQLATFALLLTKLVGREPSQLDHVSEVEEGKNREN